MDKLQKRQYMRWWRWQKREGVKHSPATRLQTYFEPGQQERIGWLVNKCRGTCDILEIGCSGGYVLERVGGKCGLDFNSKIIAENRLNKPHMDWVCWDVTNFPLPFADENFAIVLLPDILEHIDYSKVRPLIKDSLRISRSKVLITMPNAFSPDQNTRNYACFKHKWCLTRERFDKIFKDLEYKVFITPEFVMVEVQK